MVAEWAGRAIVVFGGGPHASADRIVRHVTPLAHVLHDPQAFFAISRLFLAVWNSFVANSALLR
jgi:hypothetical protein